MSTVSTPRRLVIATRASRLALWQARFVQQRLRVLYPDCAVELLELTTRGDQVLDRSLSKIGGKGLFIKELETALLDGRADLAVHSLKDVPMDLAAEFSLAAILERADARDALVSNQATPLGELPPHTAVGTSSLRREAQLRARFPQLVIRPLRGNLDTRLRKLDQGDYAAIVLAAAGLQRLGLGGRIRSFLTPEESLPAAGQGALAIETLAGRPELDGWLGPLCDAATWACAMAERAVSRALGGSCQVPLAAYAVTEGDQLWLRALVARPDGSCVLRADARGAQTQADMLGAQVAQMLRAQGAEAVIEHVLSSAA